MNSKTVMETPDLPAIANSPVLQAAIDGLDVKLHDELERYRHWCEQGKQTSYTRPVKKVVQPLPSADPEAILPDAPPPEVAPEPKPPTDTGQDFTEADLQAWAEAYQEEIKTPLTVYDPRAEESNTPTQLDVADTNNNNNDVNEEETDMEEDFSIGTAGLVSIALIAFSSVTIALLLFDPFGVLRPRRPPAPAPTPTAQAPEPKAIVDRSLLPTYSPPAPAPKTTVARSLLPTYSPPPPQIVAVPVPLPPMPRASAPQPTPTVTVTATATATVPPTVEVPYIDPQTGQLTTVTVPTPATVVTIPPTTSTGGNFAVVTDPIYKDYVQPLVQPIERPSDGKIQLGAYGDPTTAAQKAEEWRRYGIPAVVVPR